METELQKLRLPTSATSVKGSQLFGHAGLYRSLLCFSVFYAVCVCGAELQLCDGLPVHGSGAASFESRYLTSYNTANHAVLLHHTKRLGQSQAQLPPPPSPGASGGGGGARTSVSAGGARSHSFSASASSSGRLQPLQSARDFKSTAPPQSQAPLPPPLAPAAAARLMSRVASASTASLAQPKPKGSSQQSLGMSQSTRKPRVEVTPDNARAGDLSIEYKQFAVGGRRQPFPSVPDPTLSMDRLAAKVVSGASTAVFCLCVVPFRFLT